MGNQSFYGNDSEGFGSILKGGRVFFWARNRRCCASDWFPSVFLLFVSGMDVLIQSPFFFVSCAVTSFSRRCSAWYPKGQENKNKTKTQETVLISVFEPHDIPKTLESTEDVYSCLNTRLLGRQKQSRDLLISAPKF